MPRRNAAPVVLCTCLAAFGWTPAAAQQIEEVIVTATKREADVQEVPISISAYSGDFIAESGISTLQDLSLYAPNFTFATSSQPTNVRLVIRGIGSAGNAAIEPAVGVFIDGIYYPRPGAVLGNLVDLASVEVLRGPQGTLFGRNTAAGALNMTTRDPGDEFEAHVEAGAGDFGLMSLEGVVSAPFTDRLGGRLAVKQSDRDGYGYNMFDDREIGARDDLTARGKLLFDVNESFTARLTLDYNEINVDGSVIELDPSSANPVFNGTLNALFGDTAQTEDGYDYVVNQDHQDSLHDEQWGAALDLEFQLGDFTLRSTSARREWAADTRESSLRIPADVLPRSTDYDTRTASQEFQLLSPSGERVEYILGLYVYDEEYDIGQDFDAGADACIPVVFAMAGATAAGACAAGPQAPAITSDFAQSLTTYAAFAQTTIAATDRMSFTVGARYTSEEKDASFEQVILNPVIGSLFRVAENEPGLNADDTAVTWLLNASFFPADNLMLFATASTGFKGGGFNSEGANVALGADARTFDAETSMNAELGLKSRVMDGRLVANVTAYHTELEDFQDRSFDGLSFLTRNAGSRTQAGIEADVMFRPHESLQLIGGVSYLDAEFDRFEAASPLPGNTAPQDLSGQRPHFSPEWQGSLIAEWSRTLGESGLIGFLRGEVQYVGEQNVSGNTNQNPQSMQGSYTLTNLRAGFGNDRWRFALYGKNLTEEAYCQVYFDQPLGDALGAVNLANNTTVQRCVLGEPRTWGATIRYDF